MDTATEDTTALQSQDQEASPRFNQLYRHFDADGQLLYVGISFSAVYRLSQHRDSSNWYERIAKVTIENFPSRQEVVEAERRAITEENPIHNKVHRPKPVYTRFKTRLADSRQAGVSRVELTTRLVSFQPFYKFSEAASTLGVPLETLKRWIDEGLLSYIEFEGAVPKGKYEGRPPKLHQRISGWQLISLIEYLGAQSVPDA